MSTEIRLLLFVRIGLGRGSTVGPGRHVPLILFLSLLLTCDAVNRVKLLLLLFELWSLGFPGVVGLVVPLEVR